MQKQRHTWDTRAWLVGTLGGAIGGSLASWATYSPIRNRLNSIPTLFNYHTADVFTGVSAILTVFVLPGIISGLSRRFTFLWGMLPLSAFLVSVDLEDWVGNGNDVTDFFWARLAFIFACLVISSGPVSLIRWLRVRATRRHAALLASYQAQRGAASVPQEGVWPPPPEYRE